MAVAVALPKDQGGLKVGLEPRSTRWKPSVLAVARPGAKGEVPDNGGKAYAGFEEDPADPFESGAVALMCRSNGRLLGNARLYESLRGF